MVKTYKNASVKAHFSLSNILPKVPCMQKASARAKATNPKLQEAIVAA